MRLVLLLLLASTINGNVFAQQAECLEECQPVWQAEPSPIRLLCDPPPCDNWLTLEYLLFWSDGYRVPDLISGAVPGTPRADAGVLGLPSTTRLLGSEDLGDGSRSGMLLDFGRWLDGCGDLALTGSFLLLDNGGSSQTFPSTPDTIVSRPFFNVNPAVDAPDAELVNYPGVVDGTISVESENEIFSGGVGLLKRLACCSAPCGCRSRRVDLTLGYRAFAANEALTIDETLNPDGGFLPVGTQIDVMDRFETKNHFHGVQIGIRSAWQRQRWLLETHSSVAIGNVNQRVIIDGSTTTTVPGIDPAIQPWGILAQPSNIGEYERNRFGVLTGSYIGIGYQLNCRVRLRAGYNVIMLNRVVRPGPQIDTTVNSTQLDPNVPVTGPLRPAFAWRNEESLVLHGLRLGAEFSF